MNEVKCYRVNTWWHWCRSKFHGAALSKALLVEVNLDNLMGLKEETHDNMLSIARCHKEHDEPLELIKAICAEAFYHTYGQQVRVVRGRKVPQGTVGECFWMGYKSYGRVSARPEEVYKVLRIGIRDEAGAVYWTTLNNVEVIPAFEHDAVYCPGFDRKFLDIPSLYGQEETDELKAIRVELEELHRKYAGMHEQLAIAYLRRNDIQEKVGDSPELYAAWDEYDAIFGKFSDVRKDLEDATKKYYEVWGKDIFPLVDKEKTERRQTA